MAKPRMRSLSAATSVYMAPWGSSRCGCAARPSSAGWLCAPHALVAGLGLAKADRSEWRVDEHVVGDEAAGCRTALAGQAVADLADLADLAEVVERDVGELRAAGTRRWPRRWGRWFPACRRPGYSHARPALRQRFRGRCWRCLGAAGGGQDVACVDGAVSGWGLDGQGDVAAGLVLDAACGCREQDVDALRGECLVDFGCYVRSSRLASCGLRSMIVTWLPTRP
jgi:hypothetical protein